MRDSLRGSSLVLEANGTQLSVAIPKLVPRLPRHPVLMAQVGHPFSALQATYKFDS